MQDLHVTHSVRCKSKDAGNLRRGTYIENLPRQRCSWLRDYSQLCILVASLPLVCPDGVQRQAAARR